MGDDGRMPYLSMVAKGTKRYSRASKGHGGNHRHPLLLGKAKEAPIGAGAGQLTLAGFWGVDPEKAPSQAKCHKVAKGESNMKYRIELDLRKAAFRYGEAQEIARILRSLAEALDHGETVETSLRDECGEVIGQAFYHANEEWEEEPAGW